MYIAVEPVRDFVRILQQDVVLLLENTLQADQFDLLFFHKNQQAIHRLRLRTYFLRSNRVRVLFDS